MPVITIRVPDELRKKTGSQAELERVEKGFRVRNGFVEKEMERFEFSTKTAIPDLANLETMNAIRKAIITERIEK
ncbi:MAG: hypothetical protein QXD49_07270 [Archaeoglobaceae archaeon]